MRRGLWFVVWMVSLLVLSGCGDDGNSSGGDTNDQAIALNCQQRCVERLVECELAEDQASFLCMNDVCNHKPTERQLSCAEFSTCEEILTTENLCGIGADTNNADTNNGDANNGDGNNSDANNGDENNDDANNDECQEVMCDCDGTPLEGQFYVDGQCSTDCDQICTILGG